ncbi:MAG TPA: histidine kinase [Chitinophagaceae bacterium]|nr:histidine kinase [Chitinophagaceae bacterium]
MSRVAISKYWVFQIGGWGLFALVNTFFAYSFEKLSDKQDVLLFFGRLGIFVVLGLVMTHLMRAVIIRLNTLLQPFDKQILQFLLITFLFSLVVSYFNTKLLAQYGWLSSSEIQILKKNLALLVMSGAFYFFVYFFIWNLIYFTYHYVSKSRKQQLDTLQLEALVKELELKTIKAHINPHFIFNALNSIRALIDEEPSRARRAVTELSNILRSSLKAEKGETVTFEEELKIVRDYLALETMRFEDRLQVAYEIDDDTLALQVPPMMMQTLVENAIKHGIGKQVRGGVVRIISDLEEGRHVLRVQNTGVLRTDARADGFGLSSTQDRLNLLYGAKALFEIKQVSDNLVEATVAIPSSINQPIYNA